MYGLKVLMIGPFPPPATGNSLPMETLRQEWSARGTVATIDLSKASQSVGVDSWGRIARIGQAAWRLLLHAWRFDVVYLSLAESRSGNARDLLFLALCALSGRSVIVHMFGGAGMRVLLARRSGVRFALNRLLLSRVALIVVEGRTQAGTFAAVAPPERIRVAKNFAEDHLFLAPAAIEAKYRDIDTVRVLFLSNMLPGKGQRELLQAMLLLRPDERNRIQLDLAGELVDDEDRRLIEELAAAGGRVQYHGTVSGKAKQELLERAHLLCLPTYYAYEGQPFTIIEAYAAGCTVMTTPHSGIPDMFDAGVNGFGVEPRSPAAVAAALREALQRGGALVEYGLRNHARALSDHGRTRFVHQMTQLLADVAASRGAEPLVEEHRFGSRERF